MEEDAASPCPTSNLGMGQDASCKTLRAPALTVEAGANGRQMPSQLVAASKPRWQPFHSGGQLPGHPPSRRRKRVCRACPRQATCKFSDENVELSLIRAPDRFEKCFCSSRQAERSLHRRYTIHG